jgi:hypothetical protein
MATPNGGVPHRDRGHHRVAGPVDHRNIAGAIIREDGIDHGPGQHDDVANAVAGAIVLASHHDVPLNFHVPFIGPSRSAVTGAYETAIMGAVQPARSPRFLHNGRGFSTRALALCYDRCEGNYQMSKRLREWRLSRARAARAEGFPVLDAVVANLAA